MSQWILKTAACLGMAAAVCASGFAGGVADRTENPEASLIRMLPKPSDWTFSEEPEIFRPESLFEYINGAAESYLSYDFLELTVGQYESGDKKASVTVEIYDMGSDLNAFGIYGAERYPDNPPIEIGTLGYIDGEVLNFISGRYYVKLLAYGADDTEGVLRAFAAATAEGMPESGETPRALRAFPDDGRVQNSEKYIKSNFLGFAFLENGYLAGYKAEGREYDAFLVPAAGEAEAEEMFRGLLAFYEKDGAEPEPSEGGWVRLKNRYGQIMFLSRVDHVLCGVSRLSDQLETAGAKTLEGLMDNIRSLDWN